MREVPVSQLTSGDVLAQPVHGRNGVVMLEAGTTLTESYIQRLKSLGISRVMIRFSGKPSGSGSNGANNYELPKEYWQLPDIERLKNDEKVRLEAVQSATRFAASTRGFENISLPIAQDKFQLQFREIMMEIVSHREYSEELGVMHQTDPFLFEQALQVSIYASIVGLAKNYDPSQLYQLALGALFADIGMTRLPVHIMKLGRDLTEEERLQVRRHTSEGYRILTNIKSMPQDSAKVALQHHERYRGEGYPFGLKHDEIIEYAQIVGLCDVYNALVSPRHHRKPFSAEEATEYLFASGNYEFDLTLIQTFLRHIRIYPISTPVLLSNGQTGYVVNTINRPLLRPVVQIVREADGSVVPSPYLVDLEKDSYLAIVRRITEK